MTEEELKQAIRLLITYYDGEGDIVDGIVMLIKEAGYMTPEMVKGLIFEVQARKCSQCPKNIIYAPVECQHEWGYYVGEDNPYKCIKCGMNKEAK